MSTSSLSLSAHDQGPLVIEDGNPFAKIFEQYFDLQQDDIEQESGTVDVAGPSESLLSPGGLTSVRALAIRSISDAPMTLLLTSSVGTLQAITIDGTFLWWSKFARLTAVRVSGVGTIEFFAAGEQ